MSFRSGGDMCLGFFETFWEQGLLPEITKGGRVLEIGCAEADWLTPMRQARPDLYLVGIDQRSTGDRNGADEIILADVLTYGAFKEAEFDAIIAVSMIEWAGMGHYKDPKDEQGDAVTLRKARYWIKPDGWLYFDVPYANPDHQKDTRRHNPDMRVYDDAYFARLFEETGWQAMTRSFFRGTLNNEQAHPDGPYMAHILKPRS